ncbi:transporter substrate-binding domain-containing protein [Chitinimonas arctica]|uniref:Transporter substrate-binding domain-containing protein n=1 Tax=Chitinimonas arctica TaxID=2594795 RepID=A0A516SII6_9NEIS|nr:transporter substrate-binding domain-containing protein [Chitinimonas arctica]QDQ27961.1 transporter substrate-binding domain-containing protein [Chitinimonas arctica]
MKRCTYATALILLLTGSFARAELLLIYYENRVPYTQFRNGALGGLLGEPAMAALTRAGIMLELREAPFNRHMALIEKNLEYACAVGRFKTPERLMLGKFSQPFYRDRPPVALVRADNTKLKGINSLQALLATPGLRLVQPEGYSYGEVLDSWMNNAKAQLVRVSESNLSLARMVVRRLADASVFAAEEAEGLQALLRDEGVELALRHYPDAPPGSLRYFFCSKQVDEVVMRRLDAAIIAPK